MTIRKCMIDPLRKARILWHCRRGMLELDLILLKFAENHVQKLNSEQLTDFEEFLTCTDPEIYSWLMEYEKPEKKEFLELVKFILQNH